MADGVWLKLVMAVVEEKQWRETMRDLFMKQIFAEHLYHVQYYLDGQLIKRKRIKTEKGRDHKSKKDRIQL